MHADDFRYDCCGVVSGLRDGGYSDDMTLAALAGNELIFFEDSCFGLKISLSQSPLQNFILSFGINFLIATF
jgi:hypothetical protein